MWSYSKDPSNSPVDAVRFMIGDTDEANPLLDDGEIEYVLKNHNMNANESAYYCVVSIVARLSAMVDKTAGKVSIHYSQMADHYKLLLSTLEQYKVQEIVPASSCTTDMNGNPKPPVFYKGMHDND